MNDENLQRQKEVFTNEFQRILESNSPNKVQRLMALKEKAIANIRNDPFDPNTWTWGHIIEKWSTWAFTNADNSHSIQTKKNYYRFGKRLATDFFKKDLESKPALPVFGAGTFQQYILFCNERSYAKSTVTSYSIMVKSLAHFLYTQGLCKKFVWESIKIPRPPKEKSNRYLTPIQVEKYFEAALPKVRVLLAFLFYTAGRITEVLNIKYKDITVVYEDVEATTLSVGTWTNAKRVSEQKEITGVPVKYISIHLRVTKGNKPREVRVPNEMYLVPGVKEIFEKIGSDPERFIFESKRSKSGHIDQTTARDWMRATKDRANALLARQGEEIIYTQPSPHYLRHAMCTYLKSRVDSENVSLFMGHSLKKNMTENYRHGAVDLPGIDEISVLMNKTLVTKAWTMAVEEEEGRVYFYSDTESVWSDWYQKTTNKGEVYYDNGVRTTWEPPVYSL